MGNLASTGKAQAGVSAALNVVKLAVAAALLLEGSAYAALIEVPIAPSATPVASTKGLVAGWEAGGVSRPFLARDDDAPWASPRAVLAESALHRASNRNLEVGGYQIPAPGAFLPLSDFALPFPIGPAHRNTWASDEVQAGPAVDLWTTLLVVAGLVAYQIRRKLRTGAVRIDSRGLGGGVIPSGRPNHPAAVVNDTR